MNYKKIEIKKGIKLHIIDTDKFKTNLFSVFLTMPLNRNDVTKNALLTAALRRGTSLMPTQEIINKKLEEMYGAAFDCGVEKIGDNHVVKFYLEALNDEFLPEKENLLQTSLDMLFDIVFNPLVENNAFKEEYVNGEKNNLKQIIEGKIDNKNAYALERCIEEMYKKKAYGLYKFGYIEDLETITKEDLYNHYKNIISTCKIDIFASGNIESNIEDIIKNNKNLKDLNQREEKIYEEEKESKTQENIVTDSMQVMQGKLVIGVDVQTNSKEDEYTTMIYNTILGGGANSKMFQNVREKASLAYTAGSSYLKKKQNIFIRAGIEIKNYDKALKIIKEQLEDMKNGEFTQDDIENAKKLILSSIESISEEQDTQITYYFGQELANSNMSIEEYKEKIEKVTKQQIIEIANKITINTIYFLKD